MTVLYELGDPVGLSMTVRNSSGNPANATAVALTITLPNATTVTPAVTNAATGVYTAAYTPTMAGRHMARWVATGTNASTFVEEFTVLDEVPLLMVPGRVCAKQRVADPDPGSVEGRALNLAVEQARGLVLAYLRRDTIATLSPAGIDAVSAVAVRVAARLWRNPTDAASESYGEHSVSWSDPRIFTGDDRTELRPWRKRRARRPIMLIPQSGDPA